MGLLLGVGIGLALIVTMVSRHPLREPVAEKVAVVSEPAESQPVAPGEKSPAGAAENTAAAADNPAAAAQAGLASPQASDAAAANAEKGAAPAASAPGAAPPAAPATASAAPDPWAKLVSIAAQQPPSSIEAVNDFDPRTPAPSVSDLRQWFAEVPGQPQNISEGHRIQNINYAGIDGLLRLKAPWRPRVALRISAYELQRLQLNFWRENQGISLQFYERHNHAWIAYQATRQPGAPFPATMIMAGSDQGRALRVRSEQQRITFDLTCDGQELTLSRGDLRLLSVPFAGMPSEVFVAGHAVLAQMQWIRAVELPREPECGPVSVDLTRPADENWITSLTPDATFEKLPVGSVELKAAKGDKPSWAILPLPTDRVNVVTLQLEDAHPGCGIFLGDSNGKVQRTAVILKEQRSGQLAVTWGTIPDGRREFPLNPDEGPASFCGAQPWLRMLIGCGMARLWTSIDGLHWAEALPAALQQTGDLGSVGIYCAPGHEPTGIRVRRVTVRELASFNQLAPLELRRARPTWPRIWIWPIGWPRSASCSPRTSPPPPGARRVRCD